MEIKILDCTLRDGGYYNDWDFSESTVEEYLKAISLSNIDYVELGLRNFSKSGFLGAFAYTTEDFLNSIELPLGPIYGVMVDAKTILESELSIRDAVNSLFVTKEESKISLVRIAAHFNEVEQCGEISSELKKLGYTVGFNLMQAGGKDFEEISEKARLVNSWNTVSVLYFADSLGNMDANEVKRIVEALRIHWVGELGIHTHDNMGKGLDNTLAAYACGVHWLDATVTGMGRGAGNTKTENLLATLEKTTGKYNSKPIYELVIRRFEDMQREYGWGTNLLYFLGAQYDIHPTYIQTLLTDNRYQKDEIVGAIDYLRKLEGTTSYNGSVLDKAISFSSSSKSVSGSYELTKKFNGQNVLLLANGPSLTRYSKAVCRFIAQRDLTVISINLVENIERNLIDIYAFSHNAKYLSDKNNYVNLDKPAILPMHRFDETELESLNVESVFDYGVELSESEFEACGSHCKIPYDITVAYVLAALLESTPNAIYLAGFDGYKLNDHRQLEMLEILEHYKLKSKCPLVSITPTSYPIDKVSVYAPNI